MIILLTNFGQSEYVGVIISIDPQANMVDAIGQRGHHGKPSFLFIVGRSWEINKNGQLLLRTCILGLC